MFKFFGKGNQKIYLNNVFLRKKHLLCYLSIISAIPIAHFYINIVLLQRYRHIKFIKSENTEDNKSHDKAVAADTTRRHNIVLDVPRLRF